MSTFNLTILAPERILLMAEPVQSLIITTVEGEVQILPGHANLVSVLETGRFVYVQKSGAQIVGVISSGFLNVENGAVKVVAETIELPGEIDLSRAKKAQQLSEKMLTDASLSEDSFKKYQLKLQRSIIRQSIAESRASNN